ncbi:MAG: hypothetical protein ACOYL6_15490 [Bacteriovoracaceae bacterium]
MLYRLNILIWMACGISSSFADSPLICDAQFEGPNTLKNASVFFLTENDRFILTSWDHSTFSNPKQHNQAHFRYQYHEISSSAGNMGTHTSLFSLNGISQDAYAYKLILDPESIVKNPKISSSVIDQDHPMVFSGGIGFFLNVPLENYVAMSPKDIGTKSLKRYSEESLKKITASVTEGPQTPEEILQSTTTYNEIIVTGKAPITNRPVTVDGIGIPCSYISRSEDTLLNDLPMETIRAILTRCHPFRGELFISFVLEAIEHNKIKYPILLFSTKP